MMFQLIAVMSDVRINDLERAVHKLIFETVILYHSIIICVNELCHAFNKPLGG